MYGILYELTPVTNYDYPLLNSQIKCIEKKHFKLYEEAQDFLKHKNYSSGTGFFAKEIIEDENKIYIVATILEIKS